MQRGNRPRSKTYRHRLHGRRDGCSRGGAPGASVSLSGYTYGGTRPHAVTQVTATLGNVATTYTYDYDANGNLTTLMGGGHTWSTKWAGFDKPRWLLDTDTTTGAVKGDAFTYNANRSRVVHLSVDAATGTASSAVPSHYSRKKVYGLGPQLEADYVNTTPNNPTLPQTQPTWVLDKIRIYVPGPEGIAGTMEFNPREPFAQAKTALVYHYDHLGSIERITPYGSNNTSYVLDGAGKPSRYSYDAWGQRRNADTWSGAPTTTADGGSDDATPRGFTGHEMLDDIGLVHMNGRIYDPLLGRFLSADIVVQFPGSLQSFNRYSYVLNNPLSFTDPSGFNVSVDDKVKEAMVKAADADEALLRSSVAGDAPDLKSIITGSAASGGADSAEPVARPATKRVERAAKGDGKGNPIPEVNPASPVSAEAAGTEKSRDQDKAARKIEATDDPDRGTDADAAKKTNELLNTLRGSVNGQVKVHRPTRVAQMLKELDQGGYIEFSARRGRTGATTWGLSHDEYDVNGRSKRVDLSYNVYGRCMPSLIEFDPYAKDALSVLAHEIAHSYLLNKGEQQSTALGPIFSETESKRVQNEIRKLLEEQEPDPDYNGVYIPNYDFYLKD